MQGLMRVAACAAGSSVVLAESRWDSKWDKVERLGKEGCIRNVLLVRHGQYVLAEKAEEKVLTPLGERQAVKTGQRIDSMKVELKSVKSSTMVRARQTAELICANVEQCPAIEYTDLLCEGKPSPIDPPSSSYDPKPEVLFRDSSRIEAAFRNTMYRDVSTTDKKETFELIVCHGNVIRYMLLRSLQLDPTAWLRFSIQNCGITWIRIRPNGNVSVRTVGDVGHLDYDEITYH